MVFEKEGIKVAIHGMSSVPERYAKEVLDKWNPKPVEGCINILFMHQSIDPYVYSPLEPPSLSLSNLPKGFDIIIDGHLHGHNIEKLDGTVLMMPGSTVITQFEKNEAMADKVIGIITIENEITTEFIPLETNRKFYYEELVVDQTTLTLREQIERRLTQILYSSSHNKKPIIRMKLKGRDTNILDQDLRNAENKFSDKAVLVLVKELESQELTEKRELLKNLREQKLSVEELGLNLLKRNLEEFDMEKEFDYETMFHLLSEDQTESALNILLGEQTTLQTFR
jgi:DNA repair exonuclease SbcCD nuclease subunit